MTYLVFFAVLLLAAVIAGVLRLFGVRRNFDRAFNVIATVVVFAPIAALSLIMLAAFAFGIGFAAHGIVRATGLFPAVSSGPFWPWWAFGGSVVAVWLVWANRR